MSGKTAHSIAFSSIEWQGGATVGDLKVRPLESKHCMDRSVMIEEA
jgi:hypothetical protein